MSERNKPTDQDILAAVRKYGNRTMTYVVRNILCSNGHSVETPWVLRALKRLERAGKVRRVRTSYLVQICWAVSEEEPGHGE